jgi:hypothetical protein
MAGRSGNKGLASFMKEVTNFKQQSKACTAVHRHMSKQFSVKEEFQGRMVWEGVVDVFDVDHPKTKTCFVWTSPVEGTNRMKFYAVLAIPTR